MIIKEFETSWVDNWYEINQFENGVMAIGEPKHLEEVYCYLVKGEHKDLLIDTGMGVVPITRALEKIRNSSKPLDIINTHWHFDHIGGNSQFEKVLVPKNIDEVQGLLRGWSHEDLQRYDFFNGFHDESGSTMPTNFDPNNFYLPGSRNIEPVLEDGYEIDLGGRTLRVIGTPGHTPGSICVFDHSFGLLFTSDLLYQGPLYCFEDEGSVEDYFKSLVKFKHVKKDIKVLHTGHNYPRSSPDLIDAALSCFERVMYNGSPDYKEEFQGKILLGYSSPVIPRLSVLVS